MEVKERKPGTLGVLMIGFNAVVREGIKSILAKDEGIEVIEDTQNVNEALLSIKKASVRECPIDVVLTETRNDQMDGVQATRIIRDAFPKVAVLVTCPP